MPHQAEVGLEDVPDDAWYVLIDPQVVFAAPSSPWGSPMFPGAVPRMRQLAEAFAGRVVVTRFVPEKPALGSWAEYYEQWPFAVDPERSAQYDVVAELADVAASAGEVVRPTFGKWGPELSAITGPAPKVVLGGVSTDCCVISTALAAADAGASVWVVEEACAGSTPENHAKALDLMRLFEPQIRVV